MRTVSTRSDTLPGSLTSAHVPISDDEAISGDSTISSGGQEPSARAKPSGSSPSESTQILLDSFMSVRSTAPHETPEGLRGQLVESPDSDFRLEEETYHPQSPARELPVSYDNVYNEMTREEYDSVYRCVPFVCCYDNRPWSVYMFAAPETSQRIVTPAQIRLRSH